MISLQFSSQDLADIDEACDNPGLHEKIRRKLLCLRMHRNEVRNGVIASVLNLSPNTVTTYLKEFREGVISGGCSHRKSSKENG